jgi:hypothetical protein
MGDASLFLALVFVSARYNAVVPKKTSGTVEKCQAGISESRLAPPASAGLGVRRLAVDLGQVDALAEALLRVRHQLRPDYIIRLERGVLENWTEIWLFVARQFPYPANPMLYFVKSLMTFSPLIEQDMEKRYPVPIFTGESS